MRRGTKFGIAARFISLCIAILVLMNTDNGRMGQEGFLLEVVATVMFLYAGAKASRWWFCGPPGVLLFWVVAAHIPSLWK